MGNLSLEDLVGAILEPDQNAANLASQLNDRLTKPRAALGFLEEVAIKLAAIAGSVPPPKLSKPKVIVFAGDHGVVASGVTPWPQEVTSQMIFNFLSQGAAVNALANAAGAEVMVVDVGVNHDFGSVKGLISKKIAFGTKDISKENAMERDQAVSSILAGADVCRLAINSGADVIILGDMGIGNTTPSAAIIAKFLQVPASSVTGRGTGIDDKMLNTKIRVIEEALNRIKDVKVGGLELLESIGGFEIGAIAGAILMGASQKTPVVIDGVISLAGFVIAYLLNDQVINYCFLGHLSKEPGAKALSDYFQLRPLINLDMRLGEGTGALLGYSVVRAASFFINDMKTFDSAGVSEKNA